MNHSDHSGDFEKHLEGIRFEKMLIRESVGLSISELIEKFPNGQERFLNSALFNQIIQSLARGTEPLSIIDDLIVMQEETTERFKDYIIGEPARMIVSSDEFEKLKDEVKPKGK